MHCICQDLSQLSCINDETIYDYIRRSSVAKTFDFFVPNTVAIGDDSYNGFLILFLLLLLLLERQLVDVVVWFLDLNCFCPTSFYFFCQMRWVRTNQNRNSPGTSKRIQRRFRRRIGSNNSVWFSSRLTFWTFFFYTLTRNSFIIRSSYYYLYTRKSIV